MTLFAIAALRVSTRAAGPVAQGERVLRFRQSKIRVMPAKAGIHISAAPPYDNGFPLSRE